MKNFSCNKYVILYAVLVIITSATSVQLVVGQSEISPVLLVPMAQSGESIYLAWSGNDTGIQKSCLGLATIMVLHLERKLT
jgi:hypothetical protein